MLNKMLSYISEKIENENHLPGLRGVASPYTTRGIEASLGNVPAYQRVPSELVDHEGNIILESLKRGTYQGLDVLSAIIELNLREIGSEKNIKGIFSMYLGESREKEISEVVSETRSHKLGATLLLENSIVSASYFDSDGNNYVLVWAHHQIPGTSLFKYPQSEREIKLFLENTAKHSGLKIDTNCKTLNSLPPLVMLATDTYKRFKINLN